MTLITPTIASFTGSYSFLSNFAPSPIQIEFKDKQRLFPTAEHLFHASKLFFLTKPEPDAWMTNLLNTTPGDSKKMGRTLKIDVDRWDAAAYAYMKRVQTLKYEQNPDLRLLLKGTKDYILIEGNSHGDKRWGQVAGVGENLLGKILMEVRGEI